jgi:hypothetical protein
LRLAISLLGEDRLGFRIVPSLCAAGTLLLTSAMARRFGADGWGQALAGLAVATAPVFLTFFTFYSVNALELLLWTAICLVLVELVRSGDERLWLAIGILAGVAALNKHTVALLAAGIVVGILASPLRVHLRRRWIWLGGALALTCSLPNLLWNLVHGWPSLEFYLSRGEGILPASVGDALFLQVTAFNPANLLLWLPGTPRRPHRRHLSRRVRRRRRLLATVAGARLEGRTRRSPIRVVLPALVLGIGIFLLPASVTLIPPERVEAFFQLIDERPEIETGDVGQWMPLTLSGRLEWRQFSDEVFAAIDALPEEERSRAVILTPHWVFAGVLEYYGREREGPPIVSPHNAYSFWTDEAADRDPVITVAIPHEIADRYFGDVRRLALVECQHCAIWRRDLPVLLARGSARPLGELLEQWRTFSIAPVSALTP